MQGQCLVRRTRSLRFLADIFADEYSTIRAKNITNEPFYWQFAEPTAVPQAVDLPLSVVNAVLYPRRAGGLSNGKAAAEAKSKME